MDPRYTGEMLKHLEKQNELLMEAYNSMSHELHKLQVEEEMLMRKFYELMAAQGLTKKNEGNAFSVTTNAILTKSVSDGGEIGESTGIVPTKTNEQQ